MLSESIAVHVHDRKLPPAPPWRTAVSFLAVDEDPQLVTMDVPVASHADFVLVVIAEELGCEVTDFRYCGVVW